MAAHRLRCLILAGLVLSSLVLQGCAKNAAQRSLQKAEKGLDTFLDSWSRGESPDKFADPSQPIQATDPDWKAGYRLLSFLTVEAKPSADKPDHVHCRVALSLKDPKGAKVEKEVVYDVQVGDKLVIGRLSR